MAFVLPRLRFLSYHIDLRDATVETLLCEDTQCDLSDMQPAAVLGRVVDLQTLGEPVSCLGCKGLLERGELRRGEMIAHQNPLVGIGITGIKQVRDLVRPVDRGALRGDGDRPPPRQGLGAQQHVGCPDPFLCIIVPSGLARLGWPGPARFLHQLPGLFLHGDQRGPWIRGALRESEDIFHGSHKGSSGLRGNHPTRVSVRLEAGFFLVCRTVSYARVSTTWSATRWSASHGKVHWAWPGGGGPHRKAITRAAVAPSRRPWREGLACFVRTKAAASPCSTTRCRTLRTVLP